MAEPASVGWLGEFRDGQRETEFRNTYLDYTRRFNITGAMIVLAASIVLTLNDLSSASPGDGVDLVRNGQSFLALLCCFLSWRFHTWQVVYAANYLLTVSVLVGTVWIDLSRPADYLLHLGMDVVVIFAVYAAVPAAVMRLVLALGFTAGLLWVHFSIKQPIYEMADVTVPVSLVIANTVGAATASLYNRVRRLLHASEMARDPGPQSG